MGGMHDTRDANYHIKDLPQFLKRVEEATKAAFPNAGRSRYATVNVLLLYWEDDDLGVIDEISVLERIFSDNYRYSTERWAIPSEDSDDSLLLKLHGFRKSNDRDDNLFIIYYGGHGYLNPSRQPIWVSSVPMIFLVACPMRCVDALLGAVFSWIKHTVLVLEC